MSWLISEQTPKNRSAESGKFSSPNNSHLSHHVSARIHHEFTTKIPPENTGFSVTRIKKRPRNQQKLVRRALKIFFQKTRNFNTADSNKPAHSTGKDSSPVEVVADNAAASAAVAVATAAQLPNGSTPPETLS
jgi:hypothetical protein